MIGYLRARHYGTLGLCGAGVTPAFCAIRRTPFAVQSIWSRKATRLSGAAKTPKTLPNHPRGGGPGLGKSRLVQTLTQRVQAQAGDSSSTAAGESASASVDQDSPVTEWRCSQHFQNSERHPVSDYLQRFLGVGHDPSSTDRFDRLARHLEFFDSPLEHAPTDLSTN